MSSNDKGLITCSVCDLPRAVRIKSLMQSGKNICKSCSMSKRMNTEKHKRNLIQNLKGKRKKEAWELHGIDKTEYTRLRRVMQCAKNRCANERCHQHRDYGARGIKFRFKSGGEAAVWILLNLGTPPDNERVTIDRINNNGHYEPGNLRWASKAEQSQNKRSYLRSAQGERIRHILTHRDDYTYEGVRHLIKQGLTDDEILRKQKWKQQRTTY